MKIVITTQFTNDGQQFFYWTLADGPDGIDEARGFGTDLIHVFSKILEWRERIARDYCEGEREEVGDREIE